MENVLALAQDTFNAWYLQKTVIEIAEIIEILGFRSEEHTSELQSQR